jgi:tRNA (guanine-N7-)-methyltransferase
MAAVFVPNDYFKILRKSDLFEQEDAPLEIDLGCGDGTFTVAMAHQFPERRFLAVERLKGRVEKTARKIKAEELGNARVLRLESAYAVGWLLPSAGVSRLHLLCPDPWPKKKHHKNRIFRQPDFISGLLRILVPGTGEFLLKSDHQGYYEDALEVLGEVEGLQQVDWEEDAFFYPQTDFEKLWLREGRTIYRGRWRRTGE